MATVTVSASTTLAALSYAAGDDIVITGATTLTVDADPGALPAIRSIRSTDPRSKLYIRNSATAYSAGNLWKVPFENGGSVVGAGGTLAFTGGATCEIEGEWMQCYVATGVANETVLDASNVLGVDVDFPYFIQAETAVGSGVYKAVPVIPIGGVGNGFIATSLQNRFGTGEVGKVLFYDHTTRLLKTGDGTNGTVFASGIKFRIPNILMWLPPFTLTVGAGGWTSATGSQPVSSSTNAPINTIYLIGPEILNINSLPSGTSVNVSSRANDGTTAATHAAGVLAYCIPNRNQNMAGKILSAVGGVYKLKKCFFSRWMIPYFNNFSEVDSDETGIIGPRNAVEIGSTGSFSYTNGLIFGSPAQCTQIALAVSSIAGDLSLSGTSVLGVVGTVGAAGYAANPLASFATALSISGMDNVRFWRAGCPAGVSFSGTVSFATSSLKNGGGISGIELLNLQLVLNDVTVSSVSNIRYSSTNGAANTTAADVAVSLAPSSKFAQALIYDFDVIDGGLAPYDAWFAFSPNSERLIVHNKIAGSIRTINCQSRTRRVVSAYSGTANVFANAFFSNQRANTITQFNSVTGKQNTIRNVRWSDLAGAVVDATSIQPVFGAVFDFPGGPVNAQNGAGGLVTNQPDVQAVYACPNTWPGLAGGLYVGPLLPKQDLDLYEFTGGAYQNNSSAIYIETSGDTAIIKATSPVTGISSVTGASPVFYGNNASTGLTYEFRLCNWGDDISAVSWGTFDGATVQSAFNSLSGYSAYTGLNLQLRITATTTSAGRVFQQCWIPVQMDTAYNPPVGKVDITALGAANGALMAVYDGSNVLQGTTTIASGTGTVEGPYDFDGTDFTYTLKIRALETESIDITSTYGADGALVPAPMAALSGYVAGPYAGAAFNKGTKTVTVSSAMTTQQLWSAWREYIVQLANFDVADVWSYPDLDLGDWNIIVSGTDLTGDLTTTGTATQASGGRFIGVVTASNGSSGVLTVTGLTAAQVYVEDDAGVQQDFEASVTGPYTYPTPFGSSGTWRLVVNRPGYFPQAFGFNPQISNSYSITLLQILNPDGTALYTGAAAPDVDVTFNTATNCTIELSGTNVTIQEVINATQDAYSTSAGMAWLANDNAETTAVILETGQYLVQQPRTRLWGAVSGAGLLGYAVSQDGIVEDPAAPYPVRYASPPSSAPTVAEIVAALQSASPNIPVNVKYVNDLEIKGVGSAADPWNPV